MGRKAEKGGRSAAYRLRKWLKRQRRVLNRFLARQSLVGNPPVFEPGFFPWTAALEKDWWTIREEADAVLRRDAPSLGSISPDHRRLDADGLWRAWFLCGYGYRIPSHYALCPRTGELVERIPGLISAFFSIHKPGTHLPPHKGVTKGMITGHLALHVPADPEKCRMWIEGQVVRWEEGRMIVFDDTRKHQVWNDSDEDRVILLVHVARPLRFPASWLSWLFFTGIRLSPFVQSMRRNFLGLGYEVRRRPIKTTGLGAGTPR